MKNCRRRVGYRLIYSTYCTVHNLYAWKMYIICRLHTYLCDVGIWTFQNMKAKSLQGFLYDVLPLSCSLSRPHDYWKIEVDWLPLYSIPAPRVQPRMFLARALVGWRPSALRFLLVWLAERFLLVRLVESRGEPVSYLELIYRLVIDFAHFSLSTFYDCSKRYEYEDVDIYIFKDVSCLILYF